MPAQAGIFYAKISAMETDKIASTHLGKKSSGSESYNPSLLVAVPREENRRQYKIEKNNLPFCGCDVWHAYEFSALTLNGLPVTRLIKIKYDCKSDFLVESKSLKLYLNSFNMSRFGSNTKECLDICRKHIEYDLSEKLQTAVTASFLPNDAQRTEIFEDYQNISDFIDEKSLRIEKFKESPEVLDTEKSHKKEYRLMFESLRSNCRVTHQPDFGDIYIYYRSEKHIKEDGLVKYLCSFRSEYHFHEECCEMIFKRIYDLLDADDELMVCALYTRRGGIDISPVRYSKNCSADDFTKLSDLNIFARAGAKQ